MKVGVAQPVKEINSKEEDSFRLFFDKKKQLTHELKDLKEELKNCRIGNLKYQCEYKREFGYSHALLCFIIGIVIGIIFPYCFI